MMNKSQPSGEAPKQRFLRKNIFWIKYFGASPLVGNLFIPLTRRFTSGYPYRIRSGFFSPSNFYNDQYVTKIYSQL